MRAVRAVYMEEPRKALRRADVTMRVRRLACERYVGERTVFYWLAEARRIWWAYRKTMSEKTLQ